MREPRVDSDEALDLVGSSIYRLVYSLLYGTEEMFRVSTPPLPLSIDAHRRIATLQTPPASLLTFARKLLYFREKSSMVGYRVNRFYRQYSSFLHT